MSDMSNFNKVKTFMNTYGQEVKDNPEFPNSKIVQLRIDLIQEELNELKEAINNKTNPELVNMKFVEVNFYFKDDTILNVFSDSGVYNNKTLDMLFEKNVKAFYEGSELYADKANYSNIESFLEISDNVTVSDQRGTLIADKLLFDIKKQKLNIISFNNNKINAKIDLK